MLVQRRCLGKLPHKDEIICICSGSGNLSFTLHNHSQRRFKKKGEIQNSQSVCSMLLSLTVFLSSHYIQRKWATIKYLPYSSTGLSPRS